MHTGIIQHLVMQACKPYIGQPTNQATIDAMIKASNEIYSSYLNSSYKDVYVTMSAGALSEEIENIFAYLNNNFKYDHIKFSIGGIFGDGEEARLIVSNRNPMHDAGYCKDREFLLADPKCFDKVREYCESTKA